MEPDTFYLVTGIAGVVSGFLLWIAIIINS